MVLPVDMMHMVDVILVQAILPMQRDLVHRGALHGGWRGGWPQRCQQQCRFAEVAPAAVLPAGAVGAGYGFGELGREHSRVSRPVLGIFGHACGHSARQATACGMP